MDAQFLKAWAVLKELGKDREVEQKARAAGKTPYQLWLEANPQEQGLPANVTQLRHK